MLGAKASHALDNASADDEHLEIQNVDQAGEQDAEIASETAKDVAGVLVALDREIVDRLRAEFGVGRRGLGQ